MEKSQKPNEGEGKSRGFGAAPEPNQQHFQHQYPVQQHQQYGTFPPTVPVPGYYAGFPQPSAPPGSAMAAPSYPAAEHSYYQHGYPYQQVSGYAVVAEGRPMRVHRDRLPCCGFGVGWILFVAGFFFAGMPWYVGAFILLCVGVDHREKAGLTACTIAALLAAIAVLLGYTKSTAVW